MAPFVLAVGIQEVFAVIVVVVSVLSWIMNLIQGNNWNAQRQQKPQPKPPTTRSELEQLIKDLSKVDKRQQEPRKEAPTAVRAQQQPRQRPERTRSGPQANPQRPGSPPPYSPTRQNTSARQSPPAPEPKRPPANRGGANLGEGIRSQQVGSRVESKVPQEVKEDLAPVKGVQLTGNIAVVENYVHPMVKFLRDPAGVRKAIILNEILQRPKSLRR